MKFKQRVRRKRGGRGLVHYGSSVVDNYGASARVQQSSSAEGRYAWLFVDSRIGEAEVSVGLHMNVRQAEALIVRLMTFIDPNGFRRDEERIVR